MNRLTLLLAICCISAPALGSEFWSHHIRVQVDVSYGNNIAQVADLYTQDRNSAETPHPTLVWIHGGGWIEGDKSTHFARTLHFLERGWHVVNLNYRQGPGTAPQAVDDVLCAYKWAVDKALKSGHSDRFVIGGSSAGGHLALMVGLLNTNGDHPCRADVVPSAVINWYGITDIESVEKFLAESLPEYNYALSWIGNEERIAEISSRYSPIFLITDEAPPIITIHGTADRVVPYAQAKALHSVLETRNRLITLEGGTHGGFSEAQHQEAMTAIFEFLAE